MQATLKTLRVHWEQVQLHWNDKVKEDFEKNYWLPMESHLLQTLKGMENLTQLMGQIRQDAEVRK